MRVREDDNFEKIDATNPCMDAKRIMDNSGYYALYAQFDGSVEMGACVVGKGKRVDVGLSNIVYLCDNEIIDRIMNPAIAAMEGEIYKDEQGH